MYKSCTTPLYAFYYICSKQTIYIMKKLLYLFLTVLIVACSSDDDGSNDPFACADFDETTPSSIARQEAINYALEDYNLLVSLYGEPIDEGFYYDGEEDIYGDFYTFYAFLFEDVLDEFYDGICYTVGSECETYTYPVDCSTSIDDCDECVGGYIRLD